MEGELGEIGEDGVFAAKKTGSGAAVAAVGDVRARARVEVVAGKPHAVQVRPDGLTVTAGEARPLEVEVTDAYGNVISGPSYRWGDRKRTRSRRPGQPVLRPKGGAGK